MSQALNRPKKGLKNKNTLRVELPYGRDKVPLRPKENDAPLGQQHPRGSRHVQYNVEEKPCVVPRTQAARTSNRASAAPLPWSLWSGAARGATALVQYFEEVCAGSPVPVLVIQNTLDFIHFICYPFHHGPLTCAIHH